MDCGEQRIISLFVMRDCGVLDDPARDVVGSEEEQA